MEHEPIIRRGELTEQSLVDALGSERSAGRRPSQVAVGSQQLEARAVAILRPAPGTLAELLGGIPNVIRDESLPHEGWELR